jgi:hypothetical protein
LATNFICSPMAAGGVRSYADQVRRVRRLGDSFSEGAQVGSVSAPDAARKEATFTAATNQFYESQMNSSSALHPTKASPGEELPEDYSRSYTGFLLHDSQYEIEVDQDVVKQEMEYLTKFVSIVCFVGGAPSQGTMSQWIAQLQRDARCPLSLGRALGRDSIQSRQPMRKWFGISCSSLHIRPHSACASFSAGYWTLTQMAKGESRQKTSGPRLQD